MLIAADPVADIHALPTAEHSLMAGNAEARGTVLVQVLVETSTVISESLPEPDSVVNTPMTTPGETTAAEAELALPSELAGSTSDGSSGLVPPVVSTADDILAELSSEESEDDEDEGWIPKGSGTPNNTGKTKKTVPVVPITPTGSKASGAVKSAQGSSSVDTTKSGATKTARPKGK